MSNVKDITPKGYKSDGCTMFPDKLFDVNMNKVCRNHDYRRNLPNVLSRTADRLFREELIEEGLFAPLAWIMWSAVAIARKVYYNE